nr:STAS domain-containing protein [Kitasatospora cineracea]
MAAVGAAPAARPGPAVRPAGGAAAPRHPEVCAGLELSEAAEQEGSSARIALSGCFCQRTAQNLRRRIHDLAGQGRTRLVVGLDGVGHLDGAGLGALVGGLKLLRGEGGTLVLAVTEPRLLKVLRTTGLVKVFEIDATVSEAPRPQARAA